ncbi:hypothetical protein R3P38DRAFT_2923217 [Favolaschia claudopus]|uniref:F-box domain-containing protein n=1 Tax=Favolaschia claudopus TaxID=2862362 RepID=A0AAW0BV83_9AGAR
MPLSAKSIVLSNDVTEYQHQATLVRGLDGAVLFASINRFALTLPPEITWYIFTLCLPDSNFIKPNPSTAPLLLCRICRLWRFLALSTPKLWASLYIDLDWFSCWSSDYESDEEEEVEGTRDELEGRLELDTFLCDWISNAGHEPLSIRVEGATDTKTSYLGSAGQVGSLLSMIGKRAEQWHKMVFLSSSACFRSMLPLDFVACPSLEQLILPEIRFSETPWMLDLPWGQLTCFRTAKISVLDCLHVLRHGRRLLDCSFSLCRDVLLPIAYLPPLNLQVLEITDTTTEFLALTLLQYLTLPSLKRFALKSDGPRHTHRDVSRLIAFASRSSFCLDTLTLCLMPVPEALLTCALHAFPSVAHLKLQLRQPTDDLIRHFRYDVDLLPHLQSLHIVQNLPCPHPSCPDPVALIKMLASRWEITLNPRVVRKTKLLSFQFSHSQPPSKSMKDFTNTLRRHELFCLLEEAGMELELGGTDSSSNWIVSHSALNYN